MRRVTTNKVHKMTAVLVLFFVAQYFLITPFTYAAPPEGKGKGNNNAGDNGKAVGKGNTPKANPASSNKGGNAAIAKANVDKQHPHQVRKNLDIQGEGNAQDNKGRIKVASLAVHGLGHSDIRGRDAAMMHVESLSKSLKKLEKARWHYNPNEQRSQGGNIQGNMGKVEMRSPFGFDPDQDRDGKDRGRVIRKIEPVLNLEALISDFEITDAVFAKLLEDLERYRSYIERYPQWSYWFTWYVSYLENRIANYIRPDYDRVAVNLGQTIDYSFNLGTQEGFEGTTLLVTTSLVAADEYNGGTWSFNRTTWRWEYTPIHYDAGEVVMEETQEVTIGEDTTLSFSYDPPDELGTRSYYELAVTVTDPESGSSYSFTYDRNIYLYRCPYGIVYNKKTGKAIAGAVVTLHNADGSIVALDKASNPSVNNPQTTDATGRYNAKLAIGKKYYLTVKAPGYDEYKSELFSERWHIVREDVGMTASTIMAKVNP